MPNLPVTVGQGATVCCANSAATKEHRALAGTLLEAVGSVAWAQEDKIDAVTALSGSGPAYIFYLAEALEKAAIDLGLEPELAARLARQTIVGAAEMLRQSPEPPAALRARVTSKGGTTEAALKILMENDALLSIMRATLQAAAARSRELAD
jgi:pyrroline-5-carboxylate reductase